MALAGAEAERILCGPLASAGNLEIVHDLALAFHASVSMIERWAATHAEFRAALKGAPEFLEHLRPDDQIADSRLVLERNEHDAVRRARHLAHKQKPRHRDAPAGCRALQTGPGCEALGCEIAAQECERMRAEREAFSSGSPRPTPGPPSSPAGKQRAHELRPRPFPAPVGGGKERHRIIAQRLDRPSGVAAAHLERTEGIGL
jgi:hypothetical protein